MISQAIWLSLSTGAYCFGTCAPLLSPLLLADPERGLRRGVKAVGFFLCGRLLAYGGLGLCAGLAGQYGLTMWTPGRETLGCIQMILGVLLVLQGAQARCFSRCAPVHALLLSNRTLFAAGFLSSLSLCPPLLLAVTVAAENGGPLEGLLFFLIFFGMTSLFLLPFSLFSLRLPQQLCRLAGRLCCVAAGLYFIWRGTFLLLYGTHIL